ncbi:MAG: rRNA maturation RNase YbeY [Anaerolineaceae bacterium]|nr:rRNA maturation RNase YbeY [Anaerolineaceae bacterium]
MISIQFEKLKRNKDLETYIKSAAAAALGSQTGEITFIVCDDEFIHLYNKEYRGVDKSTDVLSFPSDEVDPESNEVYLGDILISLEHAQIQADEAHHPLAEEVAMLAVHGVLHLLGYDHSTAEEKTEMWQLQREALAKMGIIMDSFSGDTDEYAA